MLRMPGRERLRRFLTPSVAGLAYNTAPLYRQGVRGEGESVAIIALASYAQPDLDKFDQRFVLPPLTPREIPIAGGATDTSPSHETETELDMEVAHEIAPNARILDYSAPTTSASGGDSFGDTMDRIVADGQANVVSDSWGQLRAHDSPGRHRLGRAGDRSGGLGSPNVDNLAQDMVSYLQAHPAGG